MSSQAQPLVSVIVCTRNRSEDLARCLPSLLLSQYASFELIVVDQSDNNLSRDVVVGLQGKQSRLRYIPTETRGKSRAMNLGVRSAAGSIIALTDDDCVAETDWISGVAELFTQEPSFDMIYGQVHQPADLTIDYVTPCLYFTERRVLHRGDVFGMGANMSFRASLFSRIGPFDPLLGAGSDFPGGEDFDFSYRAHKVSACIVADPSLELVHLSTRTGVEWRKVLTNYGVGDAAFYLKHTRCGDFWAAREGGLRLVKQIARVIRKYLQGALADPRPDTRYLLGFLRGLWLSRRAPIDRKNLVYLEE